MTSTFEKSRLSRDCGYSAADKAAIAALRRKLAAVLTVFLGTVAMHASFGHHASIQLQMAAAAVSGIAFASVLILSWAVVLRSGDEYRRVLLTKALLSGVAATVVLTSIYGYMEIAWPAAPRIPMLVLPIVLILLSAVAKLVVFRREQSTFEDFGR